MHEDAYTIMRDGIPDPQVPIGSRTEAPTSRGRSSRRRRGRLLAVAAGFAAGSVLAGAGGVWANHQFSDVPATHPFHGDIDWMVDHGIADGYDDGTFRPTAPVTRQAASAYLRRYNGEIEVVRKSTNPGPASTFVSTITCPTGKRVLGGGGGSDVFSLALANSGPDLTGRSWAIQLVERNGATVNPAAVEVYALCGPT